MYCKVYYKQALTYNKYSLKSGNCSGVGRIGEALYSIIIYSKCNKVKACCKKCISLMDLKLFKYVDYILNFDFRI